MTSINNILTYALVILIILGCSNNQEVTNPVDFIELKPINEDLLLKNEPKDSLFNANNTESDHPIIFLDSIKYHVIEGDLLMNDSEFLQYQLYKSMDSSLQAKENKLIGEIIDDGIVKWESDQVLNYCISKKSFKTPQQYEIVKKNFKKATSDWEKTCNIKFNHVESKDNSYLISPTPDLTFVVLYYDTKGAFIASSFFPHYSNHRRRILIDPTYFTTNYNTVGVLRHELGHAMGFRHEHISTSAPLACQGEDTQGTINLTEYDPKSVMHYFCEGMGTIELEITELDKKGSQSIYGKPKKIKS